MSIFEKNDKFENWFVSSGGQVMTMQEAVSISRIFIRLFRKELVLEKKLSKPRGALFLTVP